MIASTKPYLIRALHEWMADHHLTPLLLVNAATEGVQAPRSAVVDGKLLLNISASATSGLELGNDRIAFDARFNGASQHIDIPVAAVLAIYARENGKGMSFTSGDGDGVDPGPDEGSPAANRKAPALRLVR